MALDLWYRQDVAHILTALASAGADHGPTYLKALHDVALAFGVVTIESPEFRDNGDRGPLLSVEKVRHKAA
jgi:hypothetical protein